MSTLDVFLVVAAACVVVVWAWWLTRADSGGRETPPAARDCPECGETMLADGAGAYVCERGHRVVRLEPHPYTSDGADR